MSLFSEFFTKRLVEPFVIKPGLHIPADALAKKLRVEEGLGAEHFADQFIQKKGESAISTATGKVLDMTPHVEGGIKPGDIVLRGNSVFTTAESGWATSLTESMRTHDWHIHKSAVSHAGVVVRDHSGELKVVQMVSGNTPAELADRLTPHQKKMKATFLRKDSLADFFNIPGTPITKATVMRPKDGDLAKQAALKALALYDTQIQGAVTHPWYSKLPHSWAPDGRGGVCSTFVNMAFEGKFDQPLHIPVTPEHFVLSPAMQQVGDRAITDIEVAK
ncbi:MAG: hypothetical protein JWM80_381 [Cyanobacteria bacterium RYN_339]|nr:hypothetical protein [Cyanobacteria bacterium RYN_339]